MNTFLVTSPLQLINAAEARKHFRTVDNTLIVLRNTTQGFPLSMFKRFIDESEWDHIHYLATYDAERITKLGKAHWFYLRMKMRYRLEKLAATLGKNESLFIGNYHDPLVYYFSSALSHNTLYLIDDGTATLEVNDARKRVVNRPQLFTNFVTREFAPRAADNWAKKLTFFTVYDFEPRPSDSYIPNRYEFFRQDVKSATVSDEVWFLGTPLASTGYLTEEQHVQYLKKVRRHYEGRPFIYLPHSREPQAEVTRTAEALDCEVRRYGLPVELALVQSEPRPREIATFISSALTNCHIIFGSTLKLTAFVIQPEHLLGWHELVASIYRHFRQEADETFRVVDLMEPNVAEEIVAGRANKP